MAKMQKNMFRVKTNFSGIINQVTWAENIEKRQFLFHRCEIVHFLHENG